MLSRYFIERPILASVISILIVFAGAISMFGLPIAQYPEIVPPVPTPLTIISTLPSVSRHISSAVVLR